MFISESGIGMHASNVTAVAYGGGRFPERDEAKHRGESTVEYCSKGQVRGNKTAKGSRGENASAAVAEGGILLLLQHVPTVVSTGENGGGG